MCRDSTEPLWTGVNMPIGATQQISTGSTGDIIYGACPQPQVLSAFCGLGHQITGGAVRQARILFPEGRG